jgi:tetratricopeptide (TPR) repeat protein
VQISDKTHKLIAPMFEFIDLGGVEVKGKAEPVNAFQVLATKAEPGQLRGIQGMRSPIIGRAREIERLREAVEELRRGRGQIVSLMGEAGLGKSRLAAEMREETLAEAGVDWLEGRSLSYQTQTPYAPFNALFANLLDVPRGGADADRYAAIQAGMATVLPGMGDAHAPLIGSMLGVDLPSEAAETVKYLEPQDLRDRIFATVKEIVATLSARKPTVLVFEDLHWADPTSLDLVQELFPLTDSSMLMLMAAFRPQRQEQSWQFHETAIRDFDLRYTGIELHALDTEQTAVMCRNLLEVQGLPASVQSLILSKTEGNPFFVEEVIRSLLDTGAITRDGDRLKADRSVEDIAVPDTLSGVLTTRLDQLDDDAKRVAQTAAVIGREFSMDLLEELETKTSSLEAALMSLQRRGLVHETSRVPRRVFMFKHALTQDTAYGSLLMSRRREIHKDIADWMEEREPERVYEIGRHLLEARENTRALPYLVVAGDEAARAFSMREAISSYRRGGEIIETVGDVGLARETLEGLGAAQQFTGDVGGALETYQRMELFAAAHNDDVMRVSSLNKQAFVSAMRMGDLPAAEAKLAESEELAQSSGNNPGLAELNMTYCYIRTSNGALDDAYDRLQTAAAIGRELDLDEPKLFGMVHVANTLNLMTRFEEAHVAAEEALAIAPEAGHLGWESELLSLTMPFYLLSKGDLEGARALAEKGMNLAAQIGSSDRESSGALIQGMISRMMGDYDRAIKNDERAISAAQDSGMIYLESASLCETGSTYIDISPRLLERATPFHESAIKILDMPLGNAFASLVLAEVGFCAIARGDLESAASFLSRGLEAASGSRLFASPQLWLGLGFVSLMRGEIEEAYDLIERARKYAVDHEMRFFYPFAEMALGIFYSGTNQPEVALEHFTEAEELAESMGLLPVLWQTRAGMAAVLTDLGRKDEAEEKRVQARGTVDTIAGRIGDAELRSLFVGNATQKLLHEITEGGGLPRGPLAGRCFRWLLP